jgi:hypothetical protein
VVQHLVQVLLAGGLLLLPVIEQREAVAARPEADAPLDGDGVAVDVGPVGVGPAVQQRDLDLGRGVGAAAGPLPSDHLLEVPGPVGPPGVGPEANLDGGQHGRLARPVVPGNGVGVPPELDPEPLVAHEVLQVDFRNDPRLGGPNRPFRSGRVTSISCSAAWLLLFLLVGDFFFFFFVLLL